MRERTNAIASIDWLLLLIYMALVSFGVLNIYAATFNGEAMEILDFSSSFGKQMLWIFISLGMALIILIIDAKFFESFSFLIYGLILLLLVVVLFVGKEVAGSKSWIQFGGFALQPAEFAKFATSLAVARFLSSLNINLREFKNLWKAALIIGLPMLLILAQNDTGSALVYLAFVLVFYREGLHGGFIWIGLSIAILFVLSLLINNWIVIGILGLIAISSIYLFRKRKRAWLSIVILLVISSGFVKSVNYVFENVLADHQRTRINVYLGKASDPRGIEYNVIQSKNAIGSGGFLGKGFKQGTLTKGDFVPEQSTDFIFCTVGEEWGFIGSLFVVGLYIAFLIRLVIVAERQRSKFSRIYGYGVASILFLHFFVNIGMTIGMVPVIGIPLPFFSYGGSSLLAFTILVFIFIKQDASRFSIL